MEEIDFFYQFLEITREYTIKFMIYVVPFVTIAGITLILLSIII